MRSGPAFYFVAVVLFVVALIWLAVPGDAKLIATPVFLVAALFSLMAARGRRVQ
jgi:hypothetical protein